MRGGESLAEERKKGSSERKQTLSKERRTPDLSPKKDSRTIDRDECRLRLHRSLDGGDGPRPRQVLSTPVAQEGASTALHQVGVAFCLVWYLLLQGDSTDSPL